MSDDIVELAEGEADSNTIRAQRAQLADAVAALQWIKGARNGYTFEAAREQATAALAKLGEVK
jgi:ApbE superfamily uncharacterized protein (UPF0280 family)